MTSRIDYRTGDGYFGFLGLIKLTVKKSKFYITFLIFFCTISVFPFLKIKILWFLGGDQSLSILFPMPIKRNY